MLQSRKVNGKHFSYKCSNCHNTISESNRRVVACPICGSHITPVYGEICICINKVNGYCASLSCQHGRKHIYENHCQIHTCDSFTRTVHCVLI